MQQNKFLQNQLQQSQFLQDSVSQNLESQQAQSKYIQYLQNEVGSTEQYAQLSQLQQPTFNQIQSPIEITPNQDTGSKIIENVPLSGSNKVNYKSTPWSYTIVDEDNLQLPGITNLESNKRMTDLLEYIEDNDNVYNQNASVSTVEQQIQSTQLIKPAHMNTSFLHAKVDFDLKNPAVANKPISLVGEITNKINLNKK